MRRTVQSAGIAREREPDLPRRRLRHPSSRVPCSVRRILPASWRRRFYRAGLPARAWLAYYAMHFDTVEARSYPAVRHRPRAVQSTRMCGIVALWSRRDPIDAEVLERATRRLHHRGPDGCRFWIAPHGHVGLGHARLSIIDLRAADQQIAHEDARLH